MRSILTVILIFATMIVNGQQYGEIVEVPNKTSKQLYFSAREWFALNFKSATDVLKMDDPEAGKLIGKGSAHISDSYSMSGGLISVPITMDWYPNFTITVAVKDGKYKCDINEIFIKKIILGGNPNSPDEPFTEYATKKEFFKNASDPDWYAKNTQEGEKLSKATLKKVSQAFSSNYRLICKTEERFTELLSSLQKKMKESDNW